MNEKLFKISVGSVAILFTILLGYLVIPALMINPDIINAFAKGFVNPYSSGYSSDAIACWLILLFWIIYESPKVKYAWVCVLLGLVPGVAVGFALYLILRIHAQKMERDLKI